MCSHKIGKTIYSRKIWKVKAGKIKRTKTNNYSFNKGPLNTYNYYAKWIV